jgi:FKBP-type peptidyl-prolyl cis-trans isomerase FklB
MKKHPLAIAMAVVGLALVGCDSKPEAQAELQLSSNEQKVSYELGRRMAQPLAEDKTVQFDAEALAQGVRDVMAGKESRLSEEEMQKSFEELRQVSMQKMIELDKQALEAGRKFLEENGKREGVVTTASGLQYEVIQKGDGAKPAESDVVKVNYVGKLADGTVFDESSRHGGAIDLPLDGGVIPGWKEGLMLMSVGEKAKLYIPAELGYGDQSPSPAIPANAVLVFELELLGITQPQAQEPDASETPAE